MTSIRERGTQRRYPVCVLAMACLSKDYCKPLSCREQGMPSSAGSPP